jgi:hypothetical protein
LHLVSHLRATNPRLYHRLKKEAQRNNGRKK